jgi:hypothetical protein
MLIKSSNFKKAVEAMELIDKQLKGFPEDEKFNALVMVVDYMQRRGDSDK